VLCAAEQIWRKPKPGSFSWAAERRGKGASEFRWGVNEGGAKQKWRRPEQPAEGEPAGRTTLRVHFEPTARAERPGSLPRWDPHNCVAPAKRERGGNSFEFIGERLRSAKHRGFPYKM
jgi:hypothetical protein